MHSRWKTNSPATMPPATAPRSRADTPDQREQVARLHEASRAGLELVVVGPVQPGEQRQARERQEARDTQVDRAAPAPQGRDGGRADADGEEPEDLVQPRRELHLEPAERSP